MTGKEMVSVAVDDETASRMSNSDWFSKFVTICQCVRECVGLPECLSYAGGNIFPNPLSQNIRFELIAFDKESERRKRKKAKIVNWI